MTFTGSDCLGATHQEVPASKTFTCRCLKQKKARLRFDSTRFVIVHKLGCVCQDYSKASNLILMKLRSGACTSNIVTHTQGMFNGFYNWHSGLCTTPAKANSNFIAIYFSGNPMKNNSSRLLRSSRCFLLQPTTEHLMYFGLELEKHLWPWSATLLFVKLIGDEAHLLRNDVDQSHEKRALQMGQFSCI